MIAESLLDWPGMCCCTSGLFVLVAAILWHTRRTLGAAELDFTATAELLLGFCACSVELSIGSGAWQDFCQCDLFWTYSFSPPPKGEVSGLRINCAS